MPGFGDGFSIATIFVIVALVPTLLVVPCLPTLYEPDTRGEDVRDVCAECAYLFEQLKQPCIYVPTLAFIITNLVVVDNEWHSVMLIEGCGPDTFVYAMLKVVQVTLMAAATWAWRSTKLFHMDDLGIVILDGTDGAEDVHHKMSPEQIKRNSEFMRTHQPLHHAHGIH